MKKKYFWVIAGVLTVVSIVSFLVWDELETNIRRYSVYYAKHIPHGKDTDPVLAMTMENLDYLDKPERSDYRYDYDGINVIAVKEELYFSELFPGFSIHNTLDDSWYQFDDKGTFIGYSLASEELVKDESKKSKAYVLAYDILQPIIDIQPTPDTNLQWYFNWKYQKRFE